MPARRWSPFTSSTPQQRPSRKRSPVRRKACPNSSRSWMSCSQAGRDTLRPTAHGRTPDTDRPLRCETMGDDVAALIGHLKLGKADVMGYSLGSFVALQTAIRHPDVVDRLVLLAARMRQDDAYSEVLAALNQLEANAAMLGGSVKASPLGQEIGRA